MRTVEKFQVANDQAETFIQMCQMVCEESFLEEDFNISEGDFWSTIEVELTNNDFNTALTIENQLND